MQAVYGHPSGADKRHASRFFENGKPDMGHLAAGMARMIFSGGFQVGIQECERTGNVKAA